MKTLLFIVILIGLGAVMGSIMIGSMTFEGTVTDHPYETGLRWDEIMNIRNSVRIKIFNDRFFVGDNNIQFSIIPEDRRDHEFNISLLLTRPGDNRHDQEFLPVRIKDHQFAAKISIPLYGYWDLIFRLKFKTREVTIPKRIFAERLHN